MKLYKKLNSSNTEFLSMTKKSKRVTSKFKKKKLSIQCCKLIVSKKSCSFWDISNVGIANHAMFAQQKLLPINPLQPGVAFL